MIPSETMEINYFPADNPSPLPLDISFMHNSFHFSRFLTNLSNYHTALPVPELTPNLSCFGNNNSTSDESDKNQLRIMNERRQRRMISNRESARRSRMRKQRHLDELWSQVLRLRSENHNLLDKLNQASERHGKVLKENALLKEETSDLRQMLADAQLGWTFNGLRELEEITCTAAHLKAESSNESISCSTKNMLHQASPIILKLLTPLPLDPPLP